MLIKNQFLLFKRLFRTRGISRSPEMKIRPADTFAFFGGPIPLCSRRRKGSWKWRQKHGSSELSLDLKAYLQQAASVKFKCYRHDTLMKTCSNPTNELRKTVNDCNTIKGNNLRYRISLKLSVKRDKMTSMRARRNSAICLVLAKFQTDAS